MPVAAYLRISIAVFDCSAVPKNDNAMSNANAPPAITIKA